ncbi:hypothetical protein J0H58_14745 [bacterium]|nr:hypothetical protein [bacterium]
MAEMQPLVEIDLDVNEDFLERATGSPLADEEIRLWGRENRLALWRGDVIRTQYDLGRRVVFDIPLRCIAHPHPECRFRYVRLIADFGTGPDGERQEATIEDLSPRQVLGEDPVKIVTKRAGELSFELEELKLGPTISAEQEREYVVYFPEIRGAGVGFAAATWDFSTVPVAPLHVDRDLRVLVSFPAGLSEVQGRFRIEAKVERQGLSALIPLVGSRSARIHVADTIG